MRRIVILSCLLGLVFGLEVARGGEPRANHHFEPPSVVSAAEAIYPLNTVVSGTVVLELSLDDAGKITDIHVVKGIASLTQAAEQSARQWSFQAARLDGRPVPSKIVLAFSFVPPNVGPRV
ncbi:MAG TPA: energy transducer TonB [Candidatus Micrarchaeia archaeon]|nr:energy transducer TonB [Candidatus Micrarchaeia archaeon]